MDCSIIGQIGGWRDKLLWQNVGFEEALSFLRVQVSLLRALCKSHLHWEARIRRHDMANLALQHKMNGVVVEYIEFS